MAAGIFAANISIKSTDGAKSINTILGGTNTYEKVTICVDRVGGNEGAINVGGSTVSKTVFGEIIRTGVKKDFTVVNVAVGLGANLFVFNPHDTEAVRVSVLGYASA